MLAPNAPIAGDEELDAMDGDIAVHLRLLQTLERTRGEIPNVPAPGTDRLVAVIDTVSY